MQRLKIGKVAGCDNIREEMLKFIEKRDLTVT